MNMDISLRAAAHALRGKLRCIVVYCN